VTGWRLSRKVATLASLLTTAHSARAGEDFSGNSPNSPPRHPTRHPYVCALVSVCMPFICYSTLMSEKPSQRSSVLVRLDPRDLQALDEERQRRADRGEVADRSAIVREVIRGALGAKARP